MYDDLINALKTCLSDASCAGCIYQDERECNEMLKTACLEAITGQDNTIAYLMALNSKLSNELQNSLLCQQARSSELVKGEADG